jgi:hypothetical protein
MEYLKIKYAKKLPKNSDYFHPIYEGTTHLLLPHRFTDDPRILCTYHVAVDPRNDEYAKYVKITPLNSMKEVTCPACQEIVNAFKNIPD